MDTAQGQPHTPSSFSPSCLLPFSPFLAWQPGLTVGTRLAFCLRMDTTYDSEDVIGYSEEPLLPMAPPRKRARKQKKHCYDCGEKGVTVGHMGCEYPQDRS
jgi:hypothetical protein